MSMRKFLRMFLVCFMALFCGTVMAQEVTLDFTTNDLWSLPVNSANKATASASFSNGTYSITLAAADGYYFNTDGYLMLGKSGSTLTFTAFSFDVEKIVVIGRDAASASTKQNIYVGDVAVSTETTGAKTANTYEIAADYQAAGNIYVLKVTSNHNTQITKIEIYKKGGGSTITVPTPSISGTSPFTENTEVTISGTPEGGKTYYTTDGSDPTSSSTFYSAPFTLTETTTVKAISYDKDNNASSVASKTFTKVTYTEAANIAAFNALEAGTKNVKLTLTNAQVLGAGNNNYAIKDASGSTLIYQSGLSYTKGQILNGTIVCERADYNGFTEIKSITDNTLTVTDGTLTPKTATPEEVIAAGYFADSYKMEKVECKLDDGRYYITVGEKKIQIYDNFKYNYSITADGTYNLTGVLGAFKDVPYQFWLTEAPEAAQVITYPEAANIAAVKAMEDGTTVKLTLTDAVVNYANGTTDVFVEDATGAIDLYKLGDDFAFKAGQVLNGTLIAKYTLYKGMPELTFVKDVTVADEISAKSGDVPTPVEMTPAEAAKAENACKFITVKNITLVADGSNYYTDAEKTLQVFDKFKVNYTPNTESAMDYTGILVPFNDSFELCPTVEPTASQGGGDTPVTTSSMIKFAEGDSAADGTVFTSGELKLTLFDKNDPAKMAVDGNDAYFGTAEDYQKFDHRLKTGGKSGSKSSLTLTIPDLRRIIKAQRTKTPKERNDEQEDCCRLRLRPSALWPIWHQRLGLHCEGI